MPRNVGRRLSSLTSRRQGRDRLLSLSEGARHQVLAKSIVAERWQGRASGKPNTQYALGAMQEVDADYTRISVETAERVGKMLQTNLTAVGIDIICKLQGSVPLNIHIRGVSDVDLLALEASFFTYATSGLRNALGYYRSPTSRTSLSVLLSLRAHSEKILKEKYPAATVDVSGGKAISISGGSLQRPVDVVPSHWHDTDAYQVSGDETDRAVIILNKKIPDTLDNLPFLHRKEISDRDGECSGGLRKAIRLCKNVKADAEDEGTSIALPSFDIAAVMYHANPSALWSNDVFELSVLGETQRHLDTLARNHEHAKTLRVPDGSRLIFDTTAKLQGLNRLSDEIDDLAWEVAKEQDSRLRHQSAPLFVDGRRVLASSLGF